MKDTTTTGGLNAKQLLRILMLGAEKNEAEQVGKAEQPVAAALQARLERGLPLSPKAVDSLPAILGRLCHELAPLAGRPLGGLLLDPSTALSVIKTIKEYGKTLSERQTAESSHAVAVTIYFAAIANALVHHGEKITQHSHEHLARSFGMLASKPWMPDELGKLFAQAAEMCRSRAS